MRKLLVSLVTLGALAATIGTAAAQQSGPAQQSKTRFGLGLSAAFGPSPTPNSLVARIEVAPEFVVNGALGFRLQNGDFNEGTNFGLGASAEYRVFRTQAVNFHILGGLSYAYGSSRTETPARTDTVAGVTVTIPASTTTDSASDVALFGGFGAEYFFPGADNHFSMEVNVGPAIHILGMETETKAGNTTTTTDASAFALSLGEALSSGVLFTYYF